MSFINYSWHKIAENLSEISFAPNGMAEVEVKGKIIVIGIHNEQAFACARKCPHAGGMLSAGYLDALGNIVCPLHRYKFNPQNGRNVSGEGYYLRTFPLEVRQEGVFVRLNPDF